MMVVAPQAGTHVVPSQTEPQPELMRVIVTQGPFAGRTVEELLFYTAVYRIFAFEMLVSSHFKEGTNEGRRLLLHVAKSCSWNGLRDDSRLEVRKAQLVFSSIFTHLQSIQLAQFEKEVMDEYAAFTLAIFIEIALKNITSGTHFYERNVYWLPRSLQYNGNTRMVAVIADIKKAFLVGSGAFKKVVNAVHLSVAEPTEPAQFVVHSMTRSECDERHLALTRQEYLNHEALKGIDQVALLESHAEFELGGIPRISLIIEGHYQDLQSFSDDPSLFSILQRINIACDLIHGLLQMHQRRMYHGDIKPKNIVCTLYRDGYAEARYIDFGFSCDFSKNQKLPFLIEEGWYGAPWLTAPELFGSQDFRLKENALYKLDVYAVGAILYSLFCNFGDEKRTSNELLPPWIPFVNNSYDDYDQELKKFKDPKKLVGFQAFVKELMITHVEIPLCVLKKKQTLTLSEEMQLVIFGMLHPDPKKRMPLAHALDRVSCVLADANSEYEKGNSLETLFLKVTADPYDEKSNS